MKQHVSLRKIGLFCTDGEDFGARFETAKALGTDNIHLHTPKLEDLDDAWGERIKDITTRLGLKIAAFIAGLPGDNYNEGPLIASQTVGIARNPTAEAVYVRYAQFAVEKLGVANFGCHFGAFPRPGTEDFKKFAQRLRELCKRLQGVGIKQVRAETGQEMPEDTRDLIHEVDLDVLGCNFDTANLILWGTTYNINHALKVLADHIMAVHLKFALPPVPTERRIKWGREVGYGLGVVDAPRILSYWFHRTKYDGEVIRECEFISGDAKHTQIVSEKAHHEALLQTCRDAGAELAADL